jgi:hypothetical protein
MKAELTQKMKPSTSRPMGPQMSCPTLCGELAANGGQRGKGRQDVTRNDSLGDSVDLGVSDFERSHDVSRPLDELKSQEGEAPPVLLGLLTHHDRADEHNADHTGDVSESGERNGLVL